MADLSISSGVQALVPAVQPARADAARAAQRAFFTQALTGAQATSPVTAQTREPSPATPTVRPSAEFSSSEQPNRMLRPGSLLDIKV